MSKMLKKQAVEQNVWELALDRTRRAYDLFDHIAVSFSGGKDSTVCLHAAMEVARERGRLPLDVFFWDEEAIPPETVEYVRRVSQSDGVSLRWLCLPVKHRNACSRKSPWWYPWNPDERELWCMPLPAEATTTLPGFNGHSIPEANRLLFSPTLGAVGVIVGLRAAESLRRYRIVTTRTTDNYISVDPHAKHVSLVKPIYDWRTEDVWTAPSLFGWDYNRAYDVMQAAGITRHQQRACPPYGEEPLQGLWKYAVCWPQLWEKMIHRVPGAATAARYCRSPLYGFGNLSGIETAVSAMAGSVADGCCVSGSPSAGPRAEAPPPDGHDAAKSLPRGRGTDDAKALIAQALQRWPEDVQRQLRHRINGEIRNHYRKTREPIPAETPGVTGVTWKYLYMLAVRGDFKERRTPTYGRVQGKPAG